MALGKAVLIGAIAALAVPYVMRDGTSDISAWVHRGLVDFSLGSVQIGWSWPLFCVVTLFAWGFLAWSER